MGKRISRGAFAALERMQNVKGAGEATARAAEIADAQTSAATLNLPTDQLAERVPQAETVDRRLPRQGELDTRFEDFQGPNFENLQRAELTASTPAQLSAETIQEVGAANIPQLGAPTVAPQMQGMSTPERNVELAQEQAADEAVVRPAAMDSEMVGALGNYVDTDLGREQAETHNEADGDGRLLLVNLLDAGAKSFDVKAGEANIFGDTIELNSKPKKADAISDPHGFLRRYAGTFGYSIKGSDKLNMLEEPADPNSSIRPEMGRAAMLAVILELGNRINAQHAETDKEDNQRRFDNALDRSDIGKAIGQRVERLLYPTQGVDPQQEFTGETEQFGYNYRLTPEEQSVLGQGIIQGFADSPLFDFLQAREIVNANGDTVKVTYVTNRQGEMDLQRIRRSARIALGFKDHDRPVSLVPTKEGRLRFEGSYTQRQITTQVAPNQLSESAVEAINALGSVAHTTSPHKVLLAQAMLKRAAQGGDNNVFAKLFKQNSDYANKKYKEILQKLQAQGVDPRAEGFDSLEQMARVQAEQIVSNHAVMRSDTIQDAIARMGNAFFYGYTAINNSERLMITQTELNYQADKLSRFLVDGATPARFEKGSNNKTEKGFFRVLARSLVEGADKKTVTRQLEEFNTEKTKFVKYGKELLEFTMANESRLANAQETELNDMPPLTLSADLEAFLAKQDKDELYFVMDALHEIARYDAAPEGQTFRSRVKAEADGNSNGATIQAMQMGVRELLRPGGVLHDQHTDGVNQLTSDIRQEVFSYLVTEEEFVKEPQLVDVFKSMMNTPNKVKEFLKVPIMTSIYGKDAQFHQDTAKKFYFDNELLFKDVDMPTEVIIEKLAERIRFGLENGLGGALRHAAMAKRIGRIFNLANQIAIVEGANGFGVQAGGFMYNLESEIDLPFLQSGDVIKTMRRTADPLATASRRQVEPGVYNTPDQGSKLRNQFAVNATQNIDATIAQRTVSNVVPRQPGALVMQVYDAFMGDANSFGDLVDESNKQFYDVNTNYNMLEQEQAALLKLKAKVKAEIAKRKASGESFDIGTDGEFRGLGNFILKARGKGAIPFRDLPNSNDREKKHRDEMKRMAPALQADAMNAGWNPRNMKGEVLISAADFEKLFMKSLEILNVEADLSRMIAETNAIRQQLLNEIKRSDIRQYS